MKVVSLCTNQGIKLKFTSTHHPHTNDQVEATNKIILNLLRKKIKGIKGRWAELLPSILWALRTTPTTTTGQTPYALSHKIEAMLLVEYNWYRQRVIAASRFEEDEFKEWKKANDEGM